MLGKFFGSKTRVKILEIFLLHPGEKFYIRQLSRRLKLQLNSVRRELENLKKFGLLISRTGISQGEGGQEKKYYQINTDFVLYEEIKSLIIKAQILYERDFVDKLLKIGKPKLLVFTGFFVNNQNSPVDLLIVGSFKKKKLIKLIKELENSLSREINYTVLNNSEFKYRRDITDVFLYDVLEGKKLTVIDEFGIS